MVLRHGPPTLLKSDLPFTNKLRMRFGVLKSVYIIHESNYLLGSIYRVTLLYHNI